jgi:hypothetical protein
MKKGKRHISILGLIILPMLLLSCIEEVNLPLRVEVPKLVVDGLISNEATSYKVKLSYSGIYDKSTGTPPSLALNGAKVIIQDNLGKSTLLQQDILELGTFVTTDPNFIGTVGKSYRLVVTLPNGDVFSTKFQKMLPVPDITNLKYEFKDIPNLNNPDYYQVYANTKDPSGEQNFYRWAAYGYSRWQSTGKPCSAFSPSICYDYCWVPTTTDNVTIASDAAVNGNFITDVPVFASPIRAIGKHYIEVIQYSLDREAYTFWNLYEEQRKRVGTIFDPQPAPLEGNLINEANKYDVALGYFSVSAISRKKLTIPFDGSLPFTKLLIGQGDCRVVFPFGSLEKPVGWPE